MNSEGTEGQVPVSWNVKAGIVEEVDDYEFCSWHEYTDKNGTLFPLCDTQTVLNRIPYNELNALVNDPLADDVSCIDMDDPSRGRPSDEQVWQMIIEMPGVTNSSAFQRLEDESKRTVLKELKVRGASHRQLERLTGVGRGRIQKL